MNDYNESTNDKKYIETQKKNSKIGYVIGLIINAFISYLLIGFNTSWLLGITFPPIYATIISIIIMNFAIPLAIIGWCFQQIGVVFPIFPLTLS